MAKHERFIFIDQSVQEPTPGCHGVAFPASGYNDPRSCEYGAYLFQPDGCEDGAYYCDPERDLAPEASR